MADTSISKAFQIAPVESPHSFSGTEFGFDIGAVDGSGTFDVYADFNYKYKLSENLSLSSRVTTLYLDPSASALHPDADRNPFLISEERPPAFGAVNRVQVGTKYNATSPHAEDFKRQGMIEAAMSMPTIKDVLAEKRWTLKQLQGNWGDFLEAVAKAQLLGNGASLELINNDEIVRNLALGILNRFSELNPGKPDVRNARTLEEAMPCVEYVSKLLKDTQLGSLMTTYHALAKELVGKKDENAIYEARYIELIAGLIDAAAHQGQDNFGFRYMDQFYGELIPNGATSYGLGAALKGAYAFDPTDAHRKTLEFSFRIALQQPGRPYIYREDGGKMFDRKTGVINAEAAVEISPWRSLSLTLKGGGSQGYDELEEESSSWVGADVKYRPTETLLITSGVMKGKDGDFDTAAIGAAARLELRKDAESNKVDLGFNVEFVDREVGKIEQEIKRGKNADGDNTIQEQSAVMLSRPEQSQLMTAPDQIKTMIGEDGWSATVEVKVKDLLGIYDPLFVTINAGVFRGGRGIASSSPANVEGAVMVNVGVTTK